VYGQQPAKPAGGAHDRNRRAEDNAGREHRGCRLKTHGDCTPPPQEFARERHRQRNPQHDVEDDVAVIEKRGRGVCRQIRGVEEEHEHRDRRADGAISEPLESHASALTEPPAYDVRPRASSRDVIAR